MYGVVGIALGVLLIFDEEHRIVACILLIAWAILHQYERTQKEKLEEQLLQTRRELYSERRNSEEQRAIVDELKQRLDSIETTAKSPGPRIQKLKVQSNAMEMPKVQIHGTAQTTTVGKLDQGAWSPSEIKNLKALYEDYLDVKEMAIALSRDQSEVVDKIAEKILGQKGDLKDEKYATNHMTSWSAQSRQELWDRYTNHQPIFTIAKHFGRTRHAIIWQIINLRAARRK